MALIKAFFLAAAQGNSISYLVIVVYLVLVIPSDVTNCPKCHFHHLGYSRWSRTSLILKLEDLDLSPASDTY